jgi:hypothetical protein
MSETTTSDAPGTDVTSAPSTDAPSQTPATSDSQTSAPPSSAADDRKAPSSSDTHRSDREGLLAAVRSVVQDKIEPEKEAGEVSDATGEAGKDDPQAPPPDPQSAQDKDKDNEPDLSDAELKKLKPETRKRFERLLGQRNEARRALDEVQPQLRDHAQLTSYLQQHQLAADDVNMLLGVGAALRRGDYEAFCKVRCQTG